MCLVCLAKMFLTRKHMYLSCFELLIYLLKIYVKHMLYSSFVIKCFYHILTFVSWIICLFWLAISKIVKWKKCRIQRQFWDQLTISLKNRSALKTALKDHRQIFRICSRGMQKIWWGEMSKEVYSADGQTAAEVWAAVDYVESLR